MDDINIASVAKFCGRRSDSKLGIFAPTWSRVSQLAHRYSPATDSSSNAPSNPSITGDEITLVLDEHDKIIDIGRSITRELGYDKAELIDRDIADLFSSDCIERYFRPLKLLSAGEPTLVFITGLEFEGRHKTHGQISLKINLYWDGSQPKHSNVRNKISTSDENEKKYSAIHRSALFDNLTGLPNRVLFVKLLSKLLQAPAANKRRTAVLKLEIDISDAKFSHHPFDSSDTDRLLKFAANRLRNSLGNTYLVGRLESNVFGIVGPYGNQEHSESVIAKIYAVFNNPFSLKNERITLTPCIGIATQREYASHAEALLSVGHKPMRKTTNSCVDYTQFERSSTIRQSLTDSGAVEDIQYALSTRHANFEYQPQFDLGTGEVAGVEALIRLQRPGQATSEPSDLIAAAEETGLILPLGELIFELICAESKQIIDRGLMPGRVAINFSAHQFLHEKTIYWVEAILEKTGMAPENLEFEITETALLANNHAVIDLMRGLRDMGIHLALDDFGTGYASFRYLKHFPVNTLKIDVEFVSEMTKSKCDHEIVRSIIDLGHIHELNVAAEGVETYRQVELLREMGCDYVQGNYLSEPLTCQDLIESMTNTDKSRPAFERSR